jgi:hypothetical protein
MNRLKTYYFFVVVMLVFACGGKEGKEGKEATLPPLAY